MKPYYNRNGITIYHGDSLEILPCVGQVDCVITSPPYNLGNEPWPHLGHWKHGGSAGGQNKWRKGGDSSHGIQYGDHVDSMPWPQYVEWQNKILSLCWDIIPDTGAIFYNHKPRVIGEKLWTPIELIPNHVVMRQIIIWKRPGGVNFKQTAFLPTHEWIMLLAKPGFRLRSKGVSGLGDVWEMTPEKNPHPAPFPLALPLKVMEAVNAETFLDPFMGGGTTLRAAKDSGRKAIGIELNERYCEMAASSLEIL